MRELGPYYDFRAELAARLRTELLGPVGGVGEVLTDPPASAYATGVLYPRRSDSATQREVELERDYDPTSALLVTDDQPDTGVSLANTQAPSSMGMTFAVDVRRASEITVTINAAIYEPVDAQGNKIEAKRAERRALKSQDLRWRRIELELPPVSIHPALPGNFVDRLAPGLEVRTRIRPAVMEAVAVTVTLIDIHEIAPQDIQDEYCFFQVALAATGPFGTSPFIERPTLRGGDDEESLLSRLLYRHAPVFAVGHGCATTWDWRMPSVAESVQRVGPAVASAIRTEFVPSIDGRLTEPNREVDTTGLGMTRLGTQDRLEVIDTLESLLVGYERWVDERHADAEWLRGTEFERVALEQVGHCRAALVRMRSGIRLLERDDDAFLAFQLANRAMAMQRSRTAWIKSGKGGEPVDDGSWRPFQICFILLCLDGITDPEHDDRGIADVLWFPTGGGKTEAYLGLIAFTTFLRRLRLGDRGAGVTVIMRYTLRLLTLQQFERAATLLCAMETSRLADSRTAHPRLGSEPMSIGMWVGKAATPNLLKDADASIRKLRDGDDLQEQNPVQLQACPWCGAPMDAGDYAVDLGRRAMKIRCPSVTCDFHAGLPVHVVDEALYDARPTLIIATADKFAQIVWREQVAALFNRIGAEPGTPPPDLIVQDELHLISGPLGTLAGLYEIAIDLAADRPKVIASTATIRRARDQGNALFDRAVAQFPPAGLDARDSWFAVEVPPQRRASRMYMGLMAPNLSQASLLVRTYGALLYHAKTIEAVDDTVRDPYWTLVGYFNSLRLLAAAELQVQDDVRQTIDILAARDGIGVDARRPDAVTELTSRVKSSEIPRRLKDLERTLGNEPFDVVLATNMISVGVDVDRLGLITVMGQPQMTAEYIQATSRIGRSHPGLAVVVYNASRSRDRSHYESFAAYHGALYRQVESTSVTPFASRARDRALHAAFIGAARMLYPQARDNTSAAAVETFAKELEVLRERFLDRVRAVAPDEVDAAADDLEYVIEDWKAMATANEKLVYEAKRRSQFNPVPRPDDAALLRAHSDDDLQAAWPTLWSLRDVDVEADLYLES